MCLSRLQQLLLAPFPSGGERERDRERERERDRERERERDRERGTEREGQREGQRECVFGKREGGVLSFEVFCLLSDSGMSLVGVISSRGGS